MFKYIAEIIGKLTPNQRLLGLISILFAGVILYVAPTVVKAISNDPEVYKKEIKDKDRRISELDLTIDSLDNRIRSDQRRCTNDLAAQGIEFNNMLDDILKDVRMGKKISGYKYLAVEKYDSQIKSVYSDSIQVVADVAYPVHPKSIKVIKSDDPVLSKIETKINTMKEKIKNQ